jgi:lipid-binding SYLF domain-containing protein
VDKAGKETFMAMGSLGGGVGLGAKDLSVVFIFKNADVMKKFIESGWQFGGEADATAKADEGRPSLLPEFPVRLMIVVP